VRAVFFIVDVTTVRVKVIGELVDTRNLTQQMARCCENARAINEMPTALSPGVPPETLPVLLRSHIDLPHRAFRKHLGATAE
jgi:hypothetical protein